MKKKNFGFVSALLLFPGLPSLLYALGNHPGRSTLKEALSILTLLAFCFMILQFFLARSNHSMLSDFKMGRIVKLHKIIGYIFTCVLLVHPFLLVIPRYFEAGVDPLDAFLTIVTTWETPGLVVGIIAWFFMVILGLTSLFRKRLSISYKVWRVFHGILAIAFIVLSTWHVIDLGRHTTLPLAIYIIFTATIGVLLLLKKYLSPSPLKAENR